MGKTIAIAVVLSALIVTVVVIEVYEAYDRWRNRHREGE